MASYTQFQNLRAKGILAVVGTLLVGTASYVGGTLADSTVVTRVDQQIIFSGSSLPITGTLTEDDRVGNGTQTGWVLQNPYSEAILVKGVTLYVTTAGETTVVDVSRGTGSIATGTNAASGTTLVDNLTLATGVYELTGSLLHADLIDSDYITSGYATGSTLSYPKSFILDEYDGTNDYILITSMSTEAGSGTIFKYHIDGRQFE